MKDVPSYLTLSQGSCPPRLQEETQRTGGVLTGFSLSDSDETFTEAFEELKLE